VDVASVGLTQKSAVYHQRVFYPVPIEVGGFSLEITLDRVDTKQSGSGNYSGPPVYFRPNGSTTYGAYLVPNDQLDTSLTLSSTILSGDVLFDFQNLVGMWAFKLGPRLQVANYTDQFSLKDTTLNTSAYTSGRAYTMFGLGIAGELRLQSLLPELWNGVAPGVKFAVSQARTGSIRITSYEVYGTLHVFAGGGQTGVSSLTTPGFAVQAGYVYTMFEETVDNSSLGYAGDPAGSWLLNGTSDARRINLAYPDIRVAVTF